MAEEVPLTEGRSILIGFFSGSLIASAFVGYGLLAQIFLFIVGLLVFVDLIFSFQEQVYIASGVLGVIIGIVLAFLFSLANLVIFYTVVTFALTAVIYVHRAIMRRKGK